MDINSEKYLESTLRLKVIELGGQCFKWVSPGVNGVPDRIVLMPFGHIWFVELKTLGKTPTKLQLFIHKLLTRLGFKVVVIDSLEKLNLFLDEIRTA